jgi:hypothetical protein
MPVALIVIMAVAAAYSVYAAEEAKKDRERAAAEAERIAWENARLIEAETAEEKRRLREAQKRQLGEAKAIAGASQQQLDEGSSLLAVVGSLESEQQKQVKWLQAAGDSRAQIARMGGAYEKMIGQAEARAIRTQGWLKAASYASSAYGWANA